MPEYRFESRNTAGKTISGSITAPSIAAASEIIRKRGDFVVQVSPAEVANKKAWYQKSFSLGPSASDVQGFTNQLAVMLRAGISLRSAVEGIAEQTVNPKFKLMLEQIQRDVEGGRQFSEALNRYPKTFGMLYINMVRASEMSGGLSKMLDRISDYLLEQIETRRMVTGASTLR